MKENDENNSSNNEEIDVVDKSHWWSYKLYYDPMNRWIILVSDVEKMVSRTMNLKKKVIIVNKFH